MQAVYISGRAILVICGLFLATTAVAKDFFVGGQIPFWIIAPELGTPSDTPRGDQARPLLQARADQMFDMVIPSAVSWGWVEPRRGQLDFHRYQWARNWAISQRKQMLVQHLFWSDNGENPRWLHRLSRTEMRAAYLGHVSQMATRLGLVKRLTVVNEMLCNHDLTDRLGADIIKELFVEARREFPRALLYLNEHGCPAKRHFSSHIISDILADYADMVLRLKANGVPFDRVGFQSYFSKGDVQALGGISAFVQRYSDAVTQFKRVTGHSITITELGFESHDEAFKAAFLRAFLTMVRDHPYVDGLIVFHWLDDQQDATALVRLDGSLTQAGEVWLEVFRR